MPSQSSPDPRLGHSVCATCGKADALFCSSAYHLEPGASDEEDSMNWLRDKTPVPDWALICFAVLTINGLAEMIR